MKGSIDLITGMGIFLVLIFSLWILTYLFQVSIFQNPQVTSAFSSQPVVTNKIFPQTSNFFVGVDTVAAFAYIFFALGAVAAAAFTESNLFFAAISLIVFPIELVLSFGFHDLFFSMIQNSIFSGLVTQYPFVYTTFQYFPLITMIFAGIIIVVTFAK